MSFLFLLRPASILNLAGQSASFPFVIITHSTITNHFYLFTRCKFFHASFINSHAELTRWQNDNSTWIISALAGTQHKGFYRVFLFNKWAMVRALWSICHHYFQINNRLMEPRSTVEEKAKPQLRLIAYLKAPLAPLSSFVRAPTEIKLAALNGDWY